jgi:hypothetical protein
MAVNRKREGDQSGDVSASGKSVLEANTIIEGDCLEVMGDYSEGDSHRFNPQNWIATEPPSITLGPAG